MAQKICSKCRGNRAGGFSSGCFIDGQCPLCGGKKHFLAPGAPLNVVHAPSIGQFPQQVICPRCNGMPYKIWEVCSKCHGTGFEFVQDPVLKYEISNSKIPKYKP